MLTGPNAKEAALDLVAGQMASRPTLEFVTLTVSRS